MSFARFERVRLSAEVTQ